MLALEHDSKSAARVTPGNAPLRSGVVQTTLSLTQKILQLVPSAISPRRLSRMASCAPAASASARAMTWGSLLAVLKLVSGSLAGRQKEDVMMRQRAGPSPPSTG